MEYGNNQQHQDQFDNHNQMDREPDKEMETESYEISKEEWEYNAQLEKENEQLIKKIDRLKHDTKNKQTKYKEECEKLIDDRAEHAVQSYKLKKFCKAMQQTEEKIEKNKNIFNGEFQKLERYISQFHQKAEEQNGKLRDLFNCLQEVIIGEEDYYGDMKKCKEDLQKRIDNVKSAVALGLEELKQKQYQLKKLDQHFERIEYMQFSPELKKEIMAECIEAIKAHRKKLLDIKMKNHSMKISIEQHQMSAGNVGTDD